MRKKNGLAEVTVEVARQVIRKKNEGVDKTSCKELLAKRQSWLEKMVVESMKERVGWECRNKNIKTKTNMRPH